MGDEYVTQHILTTMVVAYKASARSPISGETFYAYGDSEQEALQNVDIKIVEDLHSHGTTVTDLVNDMAKIAKRQRTHGIIQEGA